MPRGAWGLSSPHAATITPTTFDDFFDGVDCSLRNAVQSINTMGDFGGCVGVGAYGDNDTIVLQTGTYNLTIPGNSENGNATGDLDVFSTANPIIIIGAGSDQTIIDASAISDRAIHFLEIVENATLSGLQVTGGDVSALDQSGGGILASTLVLNLTDVHLLNNSASNGGGLALACAGNIVDTRIESNQAVSAMISPDFGNGGGLFLLEPFFCGPGNTVSIENSQFIGNQAERGGGIHLARADVGINLEIHNSTLDQNRGRLNGGGLSLSGLVSTAIDYSTISRNEVPQGVGGGINDSGGEYLFLSNSTVSENLVEENGGGINSTGNVLGLYNVTIAFNEVTSGALGVLGGGGILRNPPAILDPRFETEIFNTLIANNMAVSGPDCASNGVFLSGGYNLIGNSGAPGECEGFDAPGDQVGTPDSPIDPQLGPLQLNGGSTETHALAITSPAVDRGNNVTGCQALDTSLFFDTDTVQFNTLMDDQRFLVRPVGILDPNNPICDIGAFEVQAILPPILDEFVEGGGCNLNAKDSLPNYLGMGLLILSMGFLALLRKYRAEA